MNFGMIMAMIVFAGFSSQGHSAEQEKSKKPGGTPSASQTLQPPADWKDCKAPPYAQLKSGEYDAQLASFGQAGKQRQAYKIKSSIHS